MKAVILAGGKGTRIGEESQYRPKPMVEIGKQPILWHIMKIYERYGISDFIICCGYKGQIIKEFFIRYPLRYAELRIDMSGDGNQTEKNEAEDWTVTLANTGLDMPTAGRIKKIRQYLKDEEEFFLTYGDGVGDIDIERLLECHRKAGKAITITVTKPAGRFGTVRMNKDTGAIQGFREKARSSQSFVNAGFMVCNMSVFDYLGDGSQMLEAEPFESLVRMNQMNGYIHCGFWSPMDNLRDKEYLEGLIVDGNAPWLVGMEREGMRI